MIVAGYGPTYLKLFARHVVEVVVELGLGSIGVRTGPLALTHTPECCEYESRRKNSIPGRTVQFLLVRVGSPFSWEAFS